MISFEEFMQFNEEKDSSSKPKAITAVVEALRTVFGKYDLPTRKFVWERLNSERGKELINKILRNPKTYYTDSEFAKLVQKSGK